MDSLICRTSWRWWAAFLLVSAVARIQGLVHRVELANSRNPRFRSCLGLFSDHHHANDFPAPGSQCTKGRTRNTRLTDDVLEQLGLINSETDTKSKTVFTLPFQADYESFDESTACGTNLSQFRIRLLRFSDIPRIVELCYQEYGEYTAAQQREQEADDAMFQWQGEESNERSPSYNTHLLDEQALDTIGDQLLKPYVGIALAAKCLVNAIAKITSITHHNFADTDFIPSDNACLVLTISHTETLGEEEIVGFVDLTQQAIQPEQNPSIFPTPLFWKYLTLSKNFSSTERLGGWITNLLIAPEHRGQGWSKVLVAACERIAQERWNVASMHLHCSAHPKGGLVPQQLYLGMGYTPGLSSMDQIARDGNDYGWIAESSVGSFRATPARQDERVELTSSIYVIDDVPLVFMSKTLR